MRTSSKIRFRLIAVVFAAILVAMAAVPAWSQSSTSSVRGSVTDQSNAVVPGANVVLTQLATNEERRTTTNPAGLYVFPGVVPGRYSLRVEAPGMEPYEATLTVQVQVTATVNPTLKVGSLATTVAVADVTPEITTDAPTLGRVLERRRIEQLPMNGRSFGTLLATVPGVEGGQRAFGLRAGTGEVLVDGAATTDRTWGNWQGRIGLDAVEEFKVETNNSSAKFARPVGIIVSTRSGGNQFHGTLFETHRNSAVGTARARQETWSTAPKLVRNEFGASGGGPVRIPGLYNGANRTFWFFAYEGARRISPTASTGFRVPTEAMRKGDFSDLKDSQGRLSTLYDPWSTNTTTWARQPFAHGGRLNVIDPSRLSPTAKYIFGLTPLPTHPHVNPLVDYNYWAQAPVWDVTDHFTARVDHRFSDNDRFFARFTRMYNRNRQMPGTRFSFLLVEPDVGSTIDTTYSNSFAASYTKVFNPTFFGELLLSGTRIPYQRNTGAQKNWAGEMGLPNPFGADVFPLIFSTGLTDYEFAYGNVRFQRQGNAVADTNFTKIVGRHQFLFGSHFRYEQLNNRTDVSPKAGQHYFSTGATSLYDPTTSRTNPQATPFTGQNLGNMFLGIANYSVGFRRPNYYLRDKEYALYLQDDWKVTERLTLNVGLRWEAWPGYTEKYGISSAFDRQRRAIVLGTSLDNMYRMGATLPSVVGRFQDLGIKFMTTEEAGWPKALREKNWMNLGPRLGAAYRLGAGRSSGVIRAGYRISYSSLPLSHWIHLFDSNTPMAATFRNYLTDSAQAPDRLPNYAMRSVPEIIAGVNSTNAVPLDNPVGITRGSTNLRVFGREQPDVKVQDWNLTFEKELPFSNVLRVSYLGNHASNLPSYDRFNDAIPDYVWYATTGLRVPTGEYASVARRAYDQSAYGELIEYFRWGKSNFNGAQFEVERRYAKGIGYQIFYVIGNAMATGKQGVDDTMSVYPESYYLPGTVPSDARERGIFLNYQRDTSVPKHRVHWNWIADLPFGKGKALAGGAKGIVDKLIGNWQIAGRGGLSSSYFQLPTNYYPNGQEIESYGYKYPIEDCRGGTCRPGYLWWNGYIPANQINSYDAQGRPNGVMGVPANYKPSTEPLIPYPKTPNPADPMFPYYGSNTVWMTLKDGTSQRTTYSPPLHPWQNQFMPSVRSWDVSASLFKTIPIRERFQVRLNVDFFNVLNKAGNPNSVGADGILSTRNSGNSPRQLQFSLRLSW